MFTVQHVRYTNILRVFLLLELIKNCSKVFLTNNIFRNLENSPNKSSRSVPRVCVYTRKSRSRANSRRGKSVNRFQSTPGAIRIGDDRREGATPSIKINYTVRGFSRVSMGETGF